MTEEQNRTLQDKFMLRLPDGMRDRIKQAAEKKNRSMNAEIISRLEASFGMDIPLVRGTVNTVQGMQAAAQQIVNFMQNPEVQAMFKKLAEKGPDLIEHSPDDDKSEDK